MYIPLITEFGRSRGRLYRRIGGGGGGRGGSTGAGSRSSGSAVKTTSSNLAGVGRASMPIVLGSQTLKASPLGGGGGQRTTIPSQRPFAGRAVGGGTRDEVYGTWIYGSGYPGNSTPGVDGRGFPFVFYPIVFAPPTPDAGPAYLYREGEYGKADDSSRPGGPIYQVAFSSNISVFHVIADNATVSYLEHAIPGGCHNIHFTASAAQTYHPNQSPYPRPEQAIQFYRASSVVLTLDGYNNTAALHDNSSLTPDPLPRNIDVKLMNCINETIGTTVPLVGGVPHSTVPIPVMLPLLVWAVWFSVAWWVV